MSLFQNRRRDYKISLGQLREDDLDLEYQNFVYPEIFS